MSESEKKIFFDQVSVGIFGSTVLDQNFYMGIGSSKKIDVLQIFSKSMLCGFYCDEFLSNSLFTEVKCAFQNIELSAVKKIHYSA